jgi:hypothetical protein
MDVSIFHWYTTCSILEASKWFDWNPINIEMDTLVQMGT